MNARCRPFNYFDHAAHLNRIVVRLTDDEYNALYAYTNTLQTSMSAFFRDNAIKAMMADIPEKR